MKSLLCNLVRRQALRRGWWPALYRRICRPGGLEYAEFLKRHGGLHAMGAGCSILTTTNITDPAYLRLGNNVHFSNCTLIGHDGSVAMLEQAFAVKLESVGKIDIRDNVFIGYQAIIMPNVTIGPNAIVAAGAVVTKDVAPGDIVAGVPARPIGSVQHFVEKLERQTEKLPWANLIRTRTPSSSAALDPELVRQRAAFFYQSADPERLP